MTFEGSPPGGAGVAYGAAAVAGADNAGQCQHGLPRLDRRPRDRAPQGVSSFVIATALSRACRQASGSNLGKPAGTAHSASSQDRRPTGVRPDDLPKSVTGLDAHGNLVACVVPATALPDRFSPLSNCSR